MLHKKHSQVIGVDIADSTIEIVILSQSRGAVEVTAKHRTRIAPGIVLNGRIQDTERLSEILRTSFEKIDITPDSISKYHVVAGLPESQVYTRVLDLEPHNKKERDEVLQKELELAVPLESEDIVMSHRVLPSTLEGVRVVVAVTSRSVLAEWYEFLVGLGVRSLEFDIETLAVTRSLFAEMPQEPWMVIDMGARTTAVGMFQQGQPLMMYTLATAGQRMNEVLAREFELTIEEADTKKRAIDLTKKRSKYSKAIMGELSVVAADLQASLRAVKEDFEIEIDHVYLIGGLSNMAGIVEYFSEALGLEVSQGVSKALGLEVPLEYITATGLALRGVNAEWDTTHPGFADPGDFVQASHHESVQALFGASRVRTGTQLHEQKPAVTVALQKKLQYQKYILLGILVAGLIAVPLLFRSQKKARERRAAELESQLVQFSLVQDIEVATPIALDPAEYTPDRVRGRVIENTIEISGTYNEARANARRAAEKELQDGEVLWNDPLSPVGEVENPVFPMSFTWLVYNEGEASTALVRELDRVNAQKEPYSLSASVVRNVLDTENENVRILEGVVTVSLNNYIDIGENVDMEDGENVVGEGNGEPTLEDEDTVDDDLEVSMRERVRILDTPVGYLNVRSGRGTEFGKITEVSPGNEYTVLASEEGWYEIQISDGVIGWVLGEYVELIQ